VPAGERRRGDEAPPAEAPRLSDQTQDDAPPENLFPQGYRGEDEETREQSIHKVNGLQVYDRQSGQVAEERNGRDHGTGQRDAADSPSRSSPPDGCEPFSTKARDQDREREREVYVKEGW